MSVNRQCYFISFYLRILLISILIFVSKFKQPSRFFTGRFFFSMEAIRTFLIFFRESVIISAKVLQRVLSRFVCKYTPSVEIEILDGTGNTIKHVITFEICSFISPFGIAGTTLLGNTYGQVFTQSFFYPRPQGAVS